MLFRNYAPRKSKKFPEQQRKLNIYFLAARSAVGDGWKKYVNYAIKASVFTVLNCYKI